MFVEPSLIAECQRGAPGAMDELIRSTYEDVFALARRMMGDRDQAADVTQEVYVRVLRNVLSFRGDAAFGTWLHKVTVNVCLSHLKKRSQQVREGLAASSTPFAIPGEEYDAGLAAEGADPGERAVTTDLAERTASALDSLSDDARTVVVLRDVQELSTREVAELLGISESLVKVRLHRAHAKLRELVLQGDPR